MATVPLMKRAPRDYNLPVLRFCPARHGLSRFFTVKGDKRWDGGGGMGKHVVDQSPQHSAPSLGSTRKERKNKKDR